MQTEMAKKSGFIRLKNRMAFHALSGVGRKCRDSPRRNAKNEAVSSVPEGETVASEKPVKNPFGGMGNGSSAIDNHNTRSAGS